MVALDQRLKFKPMMDVFDRYLAVTPVAHALFRTAEVAQLANVCLPPPVLDLGCGTGQFATLALESDIEYGLDISLESLEKARLTNRYRQLHCGDARNLPFADGQFRSVLSVSVLEHISDVQAVVPEVFRVLEPRGIFVATVVLSDLHDHLFYPKLFRRLWMSALARCYLHWHDRVFRHRTLLPKETWEALLVDAGFNLHLSKKVVSPSLTAWWDLLLLTAWPDRLLTCIGGTAVWHPRWFRGVIKRLFREVHAREEAEGSTLLFVAHKPLVNALDWSARRPRVWEFAVGIPT